MKIKPPKFKFSNVLLIDDNDLDNFINEKMLESTYFSKNICVRTNGQLALDYVNDIVSPGNNEAAIDCMFVDLNMPLMGGFEFIDHFKLLGHAKTLNCRIIILTSSIAHDDRIRSQKIDPEIIFINKPLTTEFLNSFQ